MIEIHSLLTPMVRISLHCRAFPYFLTSIDTIQYIWTMFVVRQNRQSVGTIRAWFYNLFDWDNPNTKDNPVDTQLLKQLLDISRQMAETRDLNPLLQYAMDIALVLFDAERGYLVLVNRDTTLDFHVRRDRNGRDIPMSEAR